MNLQMEVANVLTSIKLNFNPYLGVAYVISCGLLGRSMVPVDIVIMVASDQKLEHAYA